MREDHRRICKEKNKKRRAESADPILPFALICIFSVITDTLSVFRRIRKNRDTAFIVHGQRKVGLIDRTSAAFFLAHQVLAADETVAVKLMENGIVFSLPFLNSPT